MNKQLQTYWDDIKKVRDSRRSQITIIDEICQQIKNLDKDIFLPFLIDLMTNIHQRHTSEVFKHLMSPMKQLTYLIDLRLAINSDGSEILDEQKWNKICELLHECEMTYLGEIGFGDYEENENFTHEKVSISMGEFLQFFTNGQMSYDEQVLERLELNCTGFNEYIIREFGFSIEDCIKFCKHIKDITNEKLNKCLFYITHKNEWKKLVAEFDLRGINDPHLWWDEPELEFLKGFRTLPGYTFIHSKSDIKNIDILDDRINKLLDFFQYKKIDLKPRFYADKSEFENTPIIKLSNNYLCSPFRFLIQSSYNRINSFLSERLENKYTKHKNKALEKKVISVFKNLFRNDALYFESYYFDEKKSEQDLLIVFKGYCFIVEIKDSLFRPPFREPIKAFDRIKTDFKKSIQYGYDQCLRVENKINDGKPFKIFDIDSNLPIYEIIPSKIKSYFSIVVTQYKYGHIQTNLENLLSKEENNPYPWSISIDDLEAFILVLIKLKKGHAKNNFIKYLENRELFHEHLYCSDELELCGMFINTPEKYIEIADISENISPDPRMSEIFDAEYANGLGFANEIDIDLKKHNKTPKYAKHFDFNIITGEDFKN